MAITPVSIGPCPVEHILAVGVKLRVHRQCRCQRIVLPQGQILRLPAGILARAAGFMHGMQEGIGQKRIRLRLQGYQCIPRWLPRLRKRGKHTRAIIRLLRDRLH